MELLLLGLALGGLAGATGKRAVKGAAKVGLKAGAWAQRVTSHARMNYDDAVAEARYEHDQEQEGADG